MSATAYLGAAISMMAGVLGLIWPRVVGQVMGLQIPGRLGLSEVRATYGGLFIGAGLTVILIGNRDAGLAIEAAIALLLLLP